MARQETQLRESTRGFGLKRLCARIAGDCGATGPLGRVPEAARRITTSRMWGLIGSQLARGRAVGRRQRHGRGILEMAVRAAMEPLEPRVLMSANFLYVNDNWN